jgi:hypothetical protein
MPLVYLRALSFLEPNANSNYSHTEFIDLYTNYRVHPDALHSVPTELLFYLYQHRERMPVVHLRT